MRLTAAFACWALLCALPAFAERKRVLSMEDLASGKLELRSIPEPEAQPPRKAPAPVPRPRQAARPPSPSDRSPSATSGTQQRAEPAQKQQNARVPQGQQNAPAPHGQQNAPVPQNQRPAVVRTPAPPPIPKYEEEIPSEIAKDDDADQGDYELLDGGDPIAGFNQGTQGAAYSAWRSSCDNWKKSIRAANHLNKILSLECGRPMARQEGTQWKYQSQGTFRVKLRVH